MIIFFSGKRLVCAEKCNRRWFDEPFICASFEQRVGLYLRGNGGVRIVMCPSLSPTVVSLESNSTSKGGSLGHVFLGDDRTQDFVGLPTFVVPWLNLLS